MSNTTCNRACGDGTTEKPWISDAEIVVAGAGIAGLAFALSIHAQCAAVGAMGPRITIYEKEGSTEERQNQGYSLSLRHWGHGMTGGGMETIERLGLTQSIMPRVCPGHSFTIATPTVPLFFVDLSKDPTNTIRITHAALRQTLLEALPASVQVVWGSGVQSAQPQPSIEGDGVEVRVARPDEGGGEVETRHVCDLCVIADGVQSAAVRLLNPSSLPVRWMGACVLAGRSSCLPCRLMRGPVMTLGGDGTSLFTASYGASESVWGLMLQAPEPRTRCRASRETGLTASGAEHDREVADVLAEARQRGQVYGPHFRALLDTAIPSSVRVHNCYDVEHVVGGVGRVAVIGDAAHPVSPFSAAGANLALEDGWRLAAALMSVRTGGDVESAMRQYERANAARAQDAINQGRAMLADCFSTGLSYLLVCTRYRAMSFAISHPRIALSAAVCTALALGTLCFYLARPFIKSDSNNLRMQIHLQA